MILDFIFGGAAGAVGLLIGRAFPRKRPPAPPAERRCAAVAGGNWAGGVPRCQGIADDRCQGGQCTAHCRQHCGGKCLDL
jgi:hypothetical protein